jgi:GntR family transcriptional regulator, hexuronate regulon transcriptional repressor
MADRRLFQNVAEQIMEMIQAGEFPPGSRLPGERELAERFGVSRVTIREAEIALQAMGKVRIRTGSGVYITDACADEDLPSVSAFELTEARSLFEAEAAALAAPIISEDLLEKLDDLLQMMASETEEDRFANEADREFHMTIASASGNAAITYVIKSLWRLRTDVPEVRAMHESICHHDGVARMEEHAEIVRALRARDPAAARAAMRRHFNRLLEVMLNAKEEREIEELRSRSAASRARFLMSATLG